MEKGPRGKVSLQEAVKYDIYNRSGDGACREFSEDGCHAEKCYCHYKYCDKYKWIIDRATKYAAKTGLSVDDILQVWEEGRTYWYMNYYQEANQPDLPDSEVITYKKWREKGVQMFGEDMSLWKFVCPRCSTVQTAADMKELGVEPSGYIGFSCIGRFNKSVKGCDYTLGGLFTLDHDTILDDKGRIIKLFRMGEGY